MKMNYKSTNQHRLSTQNLFQVRVSYTTEPPPIEILLTSGERMGRFKKEKSGSFGECSNKYVSFDFAADSPIDQFFVIFKWKHTAADGELPEVKMYADMESWKWQVEGDFFNSMDSIHPVNNTFFDNFSRLTYGQMSLTKVNDTWP